VIAVFFPRTLKSVFLLRRAVVRSPVGRRQCSEARGMDNCGHASRSKIREKLYQEFGTGELNGVNLQCVPADEMQNV
jgi:hypothetical protein